MTDAIWWALTLGGIGFIFLYIRCSLIFWNLPPGPKGWPLVGNAFQHDKDRPYLTWTKWGETFGDVFTINNYGRPAILCNSFEAVYEMLVTKSAEFAGRPKVYGFDVMTEGNKDLTTPDFSPEWTRRKNVFLSNIKKYGDGVRNLEEIMEVIIYELVDELTKNSQKPFDLKEHFMYAFTNTFSLLLLGHKYGQNDEDFQKFFELLEENTKLFIMNVQTIAIDCFRWLSYLPLPYCKQAKSYAYHANHIWAKKLLLEKMENYDQSNLRCILDAYIKQHEEDKETDAKYPIEDVHLRMFITDFFMDGIGGSWSTLYSMFAILTAEQDIQNKFQKEVDRVIGGRQPDLKDRLDMPYFQALLEEVLRYCVLLPVLVPHKSMVDAELCGHFIPKETEVIPNIWAICHDPKVWGDPWKFRPERFLNNDGQMLSVDHPLRRRVLTFGAGRRKCPGENLAKNRIFLIATSWIQKFLFKPSDADKPPVHDPRTYKLGLLIIPQPHKVVVIPRD